MSKTAPRVSIPIAHGCERIASANVEVYIYLCEFKGGMSRYFQQFCLN